MEDSDRTIVVPVVQDAVQIVSASASDRLGGEEIVGNSSDLGITGRFLKHRRHVFQEQLLLIARVGSSETFQVITVAATDVYKQRPFHVAIKDSFGLIE
jgi:hypothetical protein